MEQASLATKTSSNVSQGLLLEHSLLSGHHYIYVCVCVLLFKALLRARFTQMKNYNLQVSFRILLSKLQ